MNLKGSAAVKYYLKPFPNNEHFRNLSLYLFLIFFFILHYYLNDAGDGKSSSTNKVSSNQSFEEATIEKIPMDIQNQQPPPVEEEETVTIINKNAQVVHITHIFTTYNTKNVNAFHEFKIVQDSWKDAAKYALENHQINVEFLDFIFPEDANSVPPFATHANLQYSLNDVFKGRIPIVGEPYEKAALLGKGKMLIATNSDIGVLQDFYVKAWNWANSDFTLKEKQLLAMEKTATYLLDCYLFDGPYSSNMITREMHLNLCMDDVKVVFINNGGVKDAYLNGNVTLQVGIMTLKKYCNKKKEKEDYEGVVKFIKAFVEAKSNFHLSSAFTKISNGKPPHQLSSFEFTALDDLVAPNYFAGTITRLDIDVESLKVDIKETNFEACRALAKKSGLTHPGNDVFVINPLTKIPQVLKRMSQPQGVRPFGNWIANIFVLLEDVEWRRVTGTREEAFTFHIGLGLWGRDKIPWIQRAEENKDFTLFLTSNFNAVSGGMIVSKQLKEAPASCKGSNRVGWRHFAFCKKSPASHCFGMIRFACSQYLDFNLRDVLWYFHACEEKMGNSSSLMNPMCKFCNVLMTEFKGKKFKCVEGRSEFCLNLENEKHCM